MDGNSRKNAYKLVKKRYGLFLVCFFYDGAITNMHNLSIKMLLIKIFLKKMQKDLHISNNCSIFAASNSIH